MISPKSPRIALLVADGSEMAEVVVILDVLRRLNLSVTLLACGTRSLELHGYFDIFMKADARLEDHKTALFDAIILPGGPKGARALGADGQVISFVKKHMRAQKWVCTICSASAHVLAANQLLEGRFYTTSGQNGKLYTDGVYVEAPFVEDRHVFSCKGLGYAFQFAFEIGRRFLGESIVKEQADHIDFYHWKTPESLGDAPDDKARC